MEIYRVTISNVKHDFLGYNTSQKCANDLKTRSKQDLPRSQSQGADRKQGYTCEVLPDMASIYQKYIELEEMNVIFKNILKLHLQYHF